MQSPRRAAAAAITLALAVGGGLAGTAVARADSTSILYVDSSSSACTDSGTGTEAAPYCGIQAAADAAVAGDTVDIEAGGYAGPVTIASQGTSADPIVFQAVGGRVTIQSTGSTARLVVDGASYVSVEGVTGAPSSSSMDVFGALVENSSHVTLDGLSGSFEVAGSSSDVTLSRNQALGVGQDIKIDPGSSGDIVSDNSFESADTGGISVDDASDVAITSNTLMAGGSSATGAIDISGASTGVTVENNIVAYPGPDTAAEIMVDSAAVAGTTVDYNVVWPENSDAHDVAYAWAGADYSTEAAFYQATKQGEHDLVANPEIQVGAYTSYADAPQINSANGSAPGMLSTGLDGNPCSEDPAIAVSGAGSPDYCSRGAVQLTFESAGVATSTAPVTALGVDLSSEISQKMYYIGATTPEPTPAVTYAVNWGDGTSGTYAASSTAAETSSTHTYPRVGTYPITDTATLADGSTVSTTTSFTTAGSDYTAMDPARLVDTRSGTGAPKAKVAPDGMIAVKVAGVGPIPSDVTAVALNLTVTDTTGGGYLYADADTGGAVNVSSSTLNYGKGQTIANSTIVPVGADGEIDIYNGGTDPADAIADVFGYFTQAPASGYTPVAEKRLLDTRNGTGAPTAKIAAGSAVPVTIAGADSIPSGVSAVAVHVTVTDPTSGGWIAAEADGAGTPTTSSLDFGTGQTISNTVIVPVATNGKIELYNGAASGSVDLVADVAGYFSAGSTTAYMPVAPYRAWDSRESGSSGLAPGSTTPYDLDDFAGYRLPAAATMITNITVTNVTGNGYVTAYPWGTARPGVSNLNYLKGQTVATLSLQATTGPDQEIGVYNASAGTGDLILDVYGYFSNS